MVQPNVPHCWGDHACRRHPNLVREAKTRVRMQGTNGLTLHSMGGVRAGDRGRPRRVLQSYAVGLIFNCTRQGNFVADCSQEEVWRRVRGEGVWEGRHLRRVSVGMSRFLEFRARVYSSGAAFRAADQ